MVDLNPTRRGSRSASAWHPLVGARSNTLEPALQCFRSRDTHTSLERVPRLPHAEYGILWQIVADDRGNSLDSREIGLDHITGDAGELRRHNHEQLTKDLRTDKRERPFYRLFEGGQC